jgi:Holliday junction resolvase RusA-like endonuclease
LIITFFVPGLPRPRGSKRPFVNRHTGKVAMVDMGKGSGEWMADVKAFARRAYAGPPLDAPVALILGFVLPRPKSHYRTGRLAGRLRDDAPYHHDKAPDVDKLGRGVQDALKGALIRDDCLVAHKLATKCYGDSPGVHVKLRALGATEGKARRA